MSFCFTCLPASQAHQTTRATESGYTNVVIAHRRGVFLTCHIELHVKTRSRMWLRTRFMNEKGGSPEASSGVMEAHGSRSDNDRVEEGFRLVAVQLLPCRLHGQMMLATNLRLDA